MPASNPSNGAPRASPTAKPSKQPRKRSSVVGGEGWGMARCKNTRAAAQLSYASRAGNAERTASELGESALIIKGLELADSIDVRGPGARRAPPHGRVDSA